MTTVLQLGDVVLTRVLYVDAAIDPAAVGLTPDEVRAVPWGSPTWADDGRVRAASCVWVISTAGRHIAVDPSGNIDEILHDPSTTGAHQAAYAAAFAAAGIPIESVDTVLLSHIESIGLSAVRDEGGWRRFFPNAHLLISDSALDSFTQAPPEGQLGTAIQTLIDADLVDTFGDGDEMAPGVTAEWTGMHNIGHCAFHVGVATFVGHLAVTPLHLATGPCLSQHFAPDDAWRWLQSIASDPSHVIIGPLWPSPGAIRWHGDHPVAIE
ncbi:MAG: fold metallo-hydrolase [Ilumatobacteraceae bacterium]|nr:fold metallo-hydrolase [Ilumatobacteraceae bacterium]MCU1388693.1 fold metallo-hydrolase [Ilumatobacteraceae bacterium]